LEVVGPLAHRHRGTAAGALAARLAGVVAVVPAAAAHAADAGRGRLAAAVVAAEDHAARVADQLFLAAQPLDRLVVDALPHLVVAARPVLGAEVVVAGGHKSCTG